MTQRIKTIHTKSLPLHWREAISRYRHADRLKHEQWCKDNLPNVLDRYITLTTPTHDREAQKKLLKDNLRIIEIEISAFCNRTCWFCPNSIIDRKQKIEFPESVFLRCIDNLAEIEYEGTLNFHRFNETLADRELILKRLRQARSKLPKAKLGIFTNGDYLTREYLDELRDAGMSYMLMSYYLKKNESFDKAKVLKPAMQKMANKLNLHYEVSIDTPREYGITFKYPGVEYILCRCWNPEIGGIDRGGVIDQISKRESKVRDYGCHFPLESIYIDYNCLAMPCCHLRSDVEAHKDFIMGDVREMDLFELFSSPKYIATRQLLTPHTPKPGPCATCTANTNGMTLNLICKPALCE
ncbi:radical SAM protein [uncultured Helicobacter sp.]|uniref:radical SAM/SPASM domain-containing protein n=1 Tax=uncultured Helicobacter sp. TaxID=175537 RepID=UPI00374FA606